ncbi:MAG: hypothetical protein ACXWCW_29540 [Burkholderiales bacterium]
MRSKSKTLMTLAVAGTLAWTTGAMANDIHHSTEIQTPASVSESAPWLTGQQHLAGWNSHGTMARSAQQQFSDASASTGASSGMSGYGSCAYDSAMSSGNDDAIVARVEFVDYWLLGDASSDMSAESIVSDAGSVGYDASTTGESPMSYSLSGDQSLGTGTTSSAGGSGSVAFDSSMSETSDQYASSPNAEMFVYATPAAIAIADSIGEPTPLVTEHYLVLGALDTFDPSNALVLESGSTPEDVALLQNLSRDFYVLTPIDSMSSDA